ncbi:hypothetical protein GCM10007922_15490 [Shewanella decolorationis]|nr:hypothetical protein GCM10007922_15490 [Shewanella decolorationis]
MCPRVQFKSVRFSGHFWDNPQGCTTLTRVCEKPLACRAGIEWYLCISADFCLFGKRILLKSA